MDMNVDVPAEMQRQNTVTNALMRRQVRTMPGGIIDENRCLSESWTGFTECTTLNERLFDGEREKQLQQDYEVKMYILRESANQNVVIVGERNDEDHAVPSVRKLFEKFTDEEDDEMILETDVADALCSEQIVDVPVLQITERILEVVTAFHGSESQKESLYRSSTCRDTHSGGEDRQRFSMSSSKLRTHRMRKLSQEV